METGTRTGGVVAARESICGGRSEASEACSAPTIAPHQCARSCSAISPHLQSRRVLTQRLNQRLPSTRPWSTRPPPPPFTEASLMLSSGLRLRRHSSPVSQLPWSTRPRRLPVLLLHGPGRRALVYIAFFNSACVKVVCVYTRRAGSRSPFRDHCIGFSTTSRMASAHAGVHTRGFKISNCGHCLNHSVGSKDVGIFDVDVEFSFRCCSARTVYKTGSVTGGASQHSIVTSTVELSLVLLD